MPNFVKPLEGTIINDAVTTTNVALDPFPTHIDTLGRGGYQVVEFISERDAISDERRNPGMLVYCQETNQTYQLSDDRKTWVRYVGGGKAGYCMVRRIDNVLQTAFADVPKNPLVSLWLDSSEVHFVPELLGAEVNIIGHNGFGFPFDFIRDKRSESKLGGGATADATATYSQALKSLSIEFIIPATGYVSVFSCG